MSVAFRGDMRGLTQLSSLFRFSRVRFLSTHVARKLIRGSVQVSAQRVLAPLLAALLIPMSCPELWAQQEVAPQFGNPQQDYSGQIQSDENGYPAQPYQQPTYQQPAYTQPATPYAPPAQAYQQPGDPYAAPANAAPAVVQPLPPERLEQLVAPIALYPDTLVALVLAASTYPAQVQDADQWRQAQGNAPAEQIAAGANGQIWDPSVKALTAFPHVLALMDQNLPWTTDLGTAYYNQPSDVLQAVQVMRGRAQSAGNLQPTTYEAVNYVGVGNIALAPVNPQFVYVPAYNPWVVYGQPVSPYPGFSLTATLGSIGSFIGSAAIHWGPGIAMTAFSSMPWGLLAWGVSWLVQALLFHGSNYYSQSGSVADWGFAYGGPRAASWAYAHGGYAGYGYRGMQHGYGSEGGFVHRPPSSYGYANNGYTAMRGRPNAPRPSSSSEAFVHRPPSSNGYSGGGYNTARTLPYARPSYSGYSGYRPVNGYGRGSSGYGYMGARPGYGYGGGRPGYASSAAARAPSYRSPAAAAQRPSFPQRSSPAFGGAYPGNNKMARSSGFHPFQGGHSSGSFGGGHSSSFGGGHAPKMPKMKAPKSFGGHSGGGGHSAGGGHFSGGGHSGGKHHH